MRSATTHEFKAFAMLLQNSAWGRGKGPGGGGTRPVGGCVGGNQEAGARCSKATRTMRVRAASAA